MARGAELAGVALGAEDGEQVFKGVAESFAMIVLEFVDDFEEGAQGFGAVVGEEGVLEEGAEERGDVGVLGDFGQGFGVEDQGGLAAEVGLEEVAPSEAGIRAGKELAPASELFGLGVDVVHELVDEGDGDLFDLAFGVGDFADKQVAGGVDAAFGVHV